MGVGRPGELGRCGAVQPVKGSGMMGRVQFPFTWFGRLCFCKRNARRAEAELSCAQVGRACSLLPAVGDRCPAAPEIPFPISNPGVEDRAPRLTVHVSSYSISNADTLCRYRHNQLRFSHRPLFAATQAAHARCVLGEGRGCWGNAIPALDKFLECRRGIGLGGRRMYRYLGRQGLRNPTPVSRMWQKSSGQTCIGASPSGDRTRVQKELGELPLICWTVDRASIQWGAGQHFLGIPVQGEEGSSSRSFARAPSLKSTAAELLRLDPPPPILRVRGASPTKQQEPTKTSPPKLLPALCSRTSANPSSRSLANFTYLAAPLSLS